MPSALPRAIDLTKPSNRFAAGGLLLGVLTAKLAGRGWVQAAGDGLAGFVAWSTARELDPDHPATSEAALVLSFAASVLSQTPNPLASFSVMSGLRVLSATVGPAPTPLDTVQLMGQAILAANAGEQVAAVVPGAALAISVAQEDRFSPEPFAALVGTAALFPGRSSQPRHHLLADLLSLAALGLTGTLDRPEHIASHCDQTPGKVADHRVQLSRQLALGTLASGLVLRQTRSLLPLASAVLVVGGRRLLAARR